MKGVHFDIEQRDEIHEDSYDRILIEQRKNEDSVPWAEVKSELTDSGRLTPSAPRRRGAR